MGGLPYQAPIRNLQAGIGTRTRPTPRVDQPLRGHMDGIHTEIQDPADILNPQSPTGHDLNPAIRLLDQVGDGIHPLANGRRPTRGQHPVESQINQGLQGCGPVRNLVEGAVAGHLDRPPLAVGLLPGGLQETGAELAVHVTTPIQGTDDHTGGPGPHEGTDVIDLNRDQVRIRVVEVTGPGSHQNLDPARQTHPADLLDQTDARGEPTVSTQTNTKLNPVCPLPAGHLGPGRILDGDFQYGPVRPTYSHSFGTQAETSFRLGRHLACRRFGRDVLDDATIFRLAIPV